MTDEANQLKKTFLASFCNASNDFLEISPLKMLNLKTDHFLESRRAKVHHNKLEVEKSSHSTEAP